MILAGFEIAIGLGLAYVTFWLIVFAFVGLGKFLKWMVGA